LGPAICDRIHFFGVITEEFRGQLYENCDFVVFPSRYESFGLVPLEAMVYQKPIIAAAAGAIPEVVIDGKSGLLFEPDNEQDLARKILLLINDEPLRKKLGQGAKQRVEVLSSRKMAKSSLLLYESLIERNATMKSSRVRIDLQTSQSLRPQWFQCEVLDEFERIVTERELQLGDSPLETTELPPLTTMKSSLEQSPLTSLRSDWDITRPRIIGWGFLNGIANRFIVPKIATLINSVLHSSMQMQSSLNRTLLSENLQLKNKLNQMTAELSQMTAELAQLVESTQKIAALQEDANRIHHDSFQEMKTIMDTTRIQMILESEVIRSEFSYQSKTIPEPVILDSDRFLANTGDLRLNLGCGMQIMEGYINIDERKLPGVDLVADIGKLPFDKASVAEIYAAHLVEHVLEFDLKQHILPYWHDLLKADGKLVIICPDAEHMILEYTKNNFHWDSLRKVTYGAQDYGGNFHYNMFTVESLSKILSDCGFRDLSCEKARFVNGFYEMQINAYK
jgi:predicted SAM-dependent methyltransferase